jgi:hypothetical protein
MQQPYATAAGGLQRIDLPDVFDVVVRLGVVDLMHADRVWIVVYRDVDVPADRLLNARRRAAAAGEQVDHEVVSDAEQKLVAEHQMTPACITRRSAWFSSRSAWFSSRSRRFWRCATRRRRRMRRTRRVQPPRPR